MQQLQRLSEAARARLLAVSTYQDTDSLTGFMGLDDETLDRLRRMFGGQLSPQPNTRTRWFMADLESAERMADTGDLSLAGQLMNAARRDGHLAGVLSTRTDGLVRLPKHFRGDAEVRKALEPGHDDVRSVFDEMFPPAELALLAEDGVTIGAGLGEFLPVRGRDYPVLVRHDPQFLKYVWTEGAWYYRSAVGLVKIIPGNGRWLLHTPGGRIAPWQVAKWRCIGRAYIRKEHAQLHKDNWESKLANPARVATAAAGAAAIQQQAFFQQVMAWGANTVFGLTPGYEVELLESNGRGWESFDKTIEQQNDEFVMAIAGQKVTTDGGTGFQNNDIFKSIRSDLIKSTADALAHTVNTQGIPVFVAHRWGEAAIDQRVCLVSWDVTPPKDRNSEATSYVSLGNAVKIMRDAGIPVDVAQLCARFGVPVQGDIDGDGKPDDGSTTTNVRALQHPAGAPAPAAPPTPNTTPSPERAAA